MILHTLSLTSFYMIFKEKSHKLYHKILSFLFKNGQKVTCKLCHILSNKVYICLFLHLYLYRFYTASVYSTTINSLFYRVKKLFFRVYGNSFFIVLKTKYSTTINSLFIDWVNSFFIVLQNSTFTIFTIKSQNISSYSIKRPLKFNFKAFFVYRHISLYLKLKNSNMGFLATNNTI